MARRTAAAPAPRPWSPAVGRDLRRVVDQLAEDFLAALVGRFAEGVDALEEGLQRQAAAGAVVQPGGAVRLPACALGVAQSVREVACPIAPQQLVQSGIGE